MCCYFSIIFKQLNIADGPGAPTFSIKPNTVYINETVTFYCNVTNDGNPPASIFEWLYSNETVIAKTSVNNYYFTTTSILQENSYCCIAINYLTRITEDGNKRNSTSLNSEYLIINGKLMKIKYF